MVTKEMILSYLLDYIAIEKLFRSYYEDTGCKVPITDVMDFYWHYKDIARQYAKDYQEDVRKYPKELVYMNDIYVEKEESNEHLRHIDYLKNDKNIFINKHLRYMPGEYHDHEFIEMCYVMTGKVCHLFREEEGAEEKKAEIYKGDIIIIPPGKQHKISVYDESVMVNIVVNKYTFEKTFLGDLPEDSMLHKFFSEILFFQEKGAYLIFRSRKENVLQEKLLDLMEAYFNGGPYSGKICDHYLSILFLEMLNDYEEVELSSHLGKEGELIAQILLFIRNHYVHISLEDVAEEFHYSKNYLNRIFKKHMGKTILKYIQELRLEQSVGLLHNTRMSVDEIAEHVGYEDTSYYIELFKKEYRKTPLQYRKNKNSFI